MKAREAFEKDGRVVDYFNVLSDADKLDEMLTYSKGARKVPVIVDGGKVTTGYNGS